MKVELIDMFLEQHVVEVYQKIVQNGTDALNMREFKCSIYPCLILYPVSDKKKASIR